MEWKSYFQVVGRSIDSLTVNLMIAVVFVCRVSQIKQHLLEVWSKVSFFAAIVTISEADSKDLHLLMHEHYFTRESWGRDLSSIS